MVGLRVRVSVVSFRVSVVSFRVSVVSFRVRVRVRARHRKARRFVDVPPR